MAFRNAMVPYLGGGLIVFGYAAFSWLRARRVERKSATQVLPNHDAIEPLSLSSSGLPSEKKRLA